MKNLDRKELLSILIEKYLSSVDLLCKSDGSSLIFLISKSKVYRSKIVLNSDFITMFRFNDTPLLAVTEDRSYYRSHRENKTWEVKRSFHVTGEEGFNPTNEAKFEMTDTPDSRGFYKWGPFVFFTLAGK